MSKGDYEVGYGKPPKHTRWVTGESGNKRRKKKAAPDVGEIVKKIRDETVNVGGVNMTTLELAIRSVATKTIKSGKVSDLKHFMSLIEQYGGLSDHQTKLSMKEDADRVVDKLFATIDRMNDIDPEMSKELRTLEEEEQKLVINCKDCGPELRRRWHLPRRKQLAEAELTSSLQNAYEKMQRDERE